jgi:PAS domain S-box-containing protein
MKLFFFLAVYADSLFGQNNTSIDIEFDRVLEIFLFTAIVFLFILAYKIRLLKNERDLERLRNETDSKIMFLKSRYASMGETVGNIAHQWKQPLNAIGSIQNSIKASLIYQGEISKEKLLKSVETSFQLLQHLAGTIDTFYRFLTYEDSSRFKIADELETIRKITEYSFENSNIKLIFELLVNPEIEGNANEFTHAMLNLILNAKDAFDNAETDSPTITVHVTGGEENCTIVVSDNAGGIRMILIDRIFDWHISSKEKGSGLGLYMTKNIIEKRFGGTIGVENKNGGAHFTINLPYKECTDYFADAIAPDERKSLEHIKQLTQKIIELEELEKTLKKWADIFEHAQWGIVIGTVEEQTLGLMNPEFARMHGYSSEELIGKKIITVFAPECLDDLQLAIKTSHERGYYSFESIHVRKDGSRFPVQIELMAAKNENDNVLYRIVNVWDISEKKAAEERLLLKKFALDHIQDAVFMIDENARFQYVNQGACTALGYSREEFERMNVGDVDPDWPQERWSERWEALKRAGSMTMELRHRRKDGTIFPVEVSANYIEFGNEHYNMTIARDITERLLLEEQKENERMRLFFERQLVGMAITSPVYGWIHTNNKLQQMLGYTQDELSRLTWVELTYPDDLVPDIEQFELLLSGKIEDYMLEKRFIRKDGTILYTNLAVSCVRNDDRSVNYVLALLEDITDKKCAYEVLALREQELRALADSSPAMMGSFHLRPDGSIYMPYVSPNIVDLFGLEPQEVAEDATLLMALNHPDDAERVKGSITESAQTMGVWHQEYRINHPLKGERWMESNTKPELHPKGGIIWYGYVHDITERKELEALLEKEHKFLTDAQRVAHTGSWYLDIHNNVLSWSDETYRIFELDKECVTDLHKTFYECVHPDDREMVNAPYLESLNTRLPYQIEHRIVMEDGRIKYVIERCEHIYDNDGTPLYSVGTVQEITERKMMEASLQEANNRYVQILDNSTDVIYLIEVTPDGRFVYVDVNAAYEEVTGIPRDVVIGLPVDEIQDETFRTILTDKFTTCLNAGCKTDYIADYPFPIGLRTFHSVLAPIQDESGRIVRIVGAARDITEKKLMGKEIEESYRFLTQLIDSIPDPIFVKDKQHTWVLLNQAFCDIIGQLRESLIGKSDYDFFPKEEADIFWEKDEAVFKSNETNVNEEYFTSADGTIHYIQTIKTKFTSDSRGEHLVGTIRDISERKQAEEAIKYLNETLEKRVMERTAQLQEAVTTLHEQIAERISAEKQLKLVDLAINSSTEAIYINDHNLSIIYVNDGACRMLGYSREELTSMKIYDIDALFSVEQIFELKEYTAGNEQTFFETKHRTKSGEIIDVEIVGNSFIHEEGEAIISVVKRLLR